MRGYVADIDTLSTNNAVYTHDASSLCRPTYNIIDTSQQTLGMRDCLAVYRGTSKRRN